ncbi:cytochrome-c peroxidase [Namhaeicola litoreus]|uniref:Cytochrome-c peroxidase n=1 Tax=Namhaeicola litoreus TaxID=1052145 RepID=A0ABW3Y1D0_9FLAO
MNRIFFTISIFIIGIVFLFVFLFDKTPTAYKKFQDSNNNYFSLCATCPPGFKLTKENKCENVNLYMQYDSPNNKGLGGLKIGLPEVRDGFSPQQMDLGRYLFFDPILSSDNKISCASCHNPELGFSDGKAKSEGMNGAVLERSAPSLWNVAYLKRLFWDARANSLEEQMQGPLFSPHEMASTSEEILKKLNLSKEYRQLFREAFGTKNEKDSIQMNEVFTAITAFETSLISLNSRYDQYAHGFANALNEKEIEGMNIFRSFVARCAECHTPPLFSNQQIAVIGSPEPNADFFDEGAQETFNDATMRGGFKVPSLRNIEKTAPYMHSGHFKTLKEAIAFYTKGRGHAVPKGENLYLHWHIWEPQLSDEEVERIHDFLKTLTDETFMPEIPKKVPSGLPIS